jgi:hypothetical protein
MTRFYHNPDIRYRLVPAYKNLSFIFYFISLSIIVLFISSCEKNPTEIGRDFLPPEDFVTLGSIDTFTVKSSTVLDETIRTDNPILSYIGMISDPYLGTTNAELVTQIRMGSEWNEDNYTVDSVKLFLRFLNVTGSVGTAHKLIISEIADQIYTDKPYYSSTPVNLTGYKVRGNRETDIMLTNLKADTINDIEIKLDSTFGQYLIRKPEMLFHSNSQPDFRSYFKGLYFQIEPDPANPLLVSLNTIPQQLASAYFDYIEVYMHNESAVTSSFYFVLDATNSNAAFNKFTYNYNSRTNTDFGLHINGGAVDTISYIQSLNGVFTKIEIPGLAEIKKNHDFKNIAINKARLTIPVYLDGGLYTRSTIPKRLYLRYSNKDSIKYIVPDYFVDQTYHMFYDGTLDDTRDVYKFNIAYYVQEYLNDSTDLLKPELDLFLDEEIKNVIMKANGCKPSVKFDFNYTRF